MDQMHIDPAMLGMAGTTIGQCAETMAGSLESLQATVTTDNPWGSDEPGSLFGMAYVAVLTHAIEVYASRVDQLLVAADGLTAWSASIDQTEQDNTGLFTGLRSRMG
jgi:hypothetical protein